MGQRLGLKVTLQPFESVESDLLWIAYFELISPLPPRFPIRSIEEIISLPFGAHPGDAYFSLMLDHHRMRRAKELRSMSTLVQVGSMVEQSWLRLRRHTGKCYRYNFLTGEEGFDSALEYVKFKPQVVVHRRTVSLALPGSEVKTGKRKK